MKKYIVEYKYPIRHIGKESYVLINVHYINKTDAESALKERLTIYDDAILITKNIDKALDKT